MIVPMQHAGAGQHPRARHADQAVGHAGRDARGAADARTAHRLRAGARSGPRRRGHRPASGHGGHLMEISAVRQQILPDHRTRETRRRGSARRERRSRRASTTSFSISWPCRCSGRSATSCAPKGYLFSLFTPGGSVRLMSDKSADDFIELVLDTTGAAPLVVGRTSRAWGRTNVSERPLNPGGTDSRAVGGRCAGVSAEGAGTVRRT